MKGRRIPLSRPRRILTDLSHASLAFPRATLRTRINVAALVAPRESAPRGARIPWPILFAKAFALVAQDMPHLRRVYAKLPWPHFYELPTSVGSIIIERDWPEVAPTEQALFLGRLKDPASTTLPDLAAAMRHHKTAPIDSIADFRRILMFAGLPLPLRRAGLWLALNLGRQVPNYFGTFAISPPRLPRRRHPPHHPGLDQLPQLRPDRRNRQHRRLPLRRPPHHGRRPRRPRHHGDGGSAQRADPGGAAKQVRIFFF